MTEEPYRWMEAIENRRDYVRDQLRGGLAVVGLSLDEGVMLVAIGPGKSKIYEVFDRQAMAGLGHPADIEKVRQSAIDAAHVESFTRDPEDVALRRLVSYGMGPMMKTAFEQVFQPPLLTEWLLAEVSDKRSDDIFYRLHFDGVFQPVQGAVAVATLDSDGESRAVHWLKDQVRKKTTREDAIRRALECIWLLCEFPAFPGDVPPEEERDAGWRKLVGERGVEVALLERETERMARYRTLSGDDLPL